MLSHPSLLYEMRTSKLLTVRRNRSGSGLSDNQHNAYHDMDGPPAWMALGEAVPTAGHPYQWNNTSTPRRRSAWTAYLVIPVHSRTFNASKFIQSLDRLSSEASVRPSHQTARS